MAKNLLLGIEKERQVKEQQKIAKAKNKKKRRSPARFFKDIWNELKKVTWPTGKDLLSSTLAVIVFIVLVGAVIGLFDFGMHSLFSLITA
jgi:preprotein translocase subunit SecE